MLVYDVAANALVLFGGWYETRDGSYHRLADTWTFFVGNGTWIQRNPRMSPSPRSDAAVAYDDTDRITLLFGGFDGEHYLGDMWYYVFVNDTWIPRSSPRLPSPRADGRMVYDPQHRTFFLFSGNDYSDASFNFHHLADMWRYSWVSNAWMQIFPDLLPSPRDYAVFAVDLTFGELLLTGGFGNRTILGDTWAFNTTQLIWRNLTTSVAPPPRMAAVGGYDSTEDVLVVYGGGDKTEIKGDSWFFRYPPPLFGNIVVSIPDPVVGQDVRFLGEIQGGSGSIVGISWDFGDGQTSHGQSALHSFRAPGTYRILFFAQDNRGSQLVRTVRLDVGVLVPLWADIVVIVLGACGVSTFIVIWVRRRRKSIP
jgi:hypothetical protein